MSDVGYKASPITMWLKDNRGITISFIASKSYETVKSRISESSLRNFIQGKYKNRRENIELLLSSYGVPKELIEQAYGKGDDSASSGDALVQSNEGTI